MPTDAAQRGKVVLNVDLFDRLTEAEGCVHDTDRARMLKVHRTTITRMRARTQSPKPELMFDIAEALNVPVTTLFTRESETTEV
jgi:transcriptional regulator with XRE-family HTH domain